MVSQITSIAERRRAKVRPASESVGFEMCFVPSRKTPADPAGSTSCGGSPKQLSGCKQEGLARVRYLMQQTSDGIACQRMQAASGRSNFGSFERTLTNGVRDAVLSCTLAQPLRSICFRGCPGNLRSARPHSPISSPLIRRGTARW